MTPNEPPTGQALYETRDDVHEAMKDLEADLASFGSDELEELEERSRASRTSRLHPRGLVDSMRMALPSWPQATAQQSSSPAGSTP